MKKLPPSLFFKLSSLAFAVAASAIAYGQSEERQIEEVLVLGSSSTFGNSLVTESMQRQQSSLTSINAVIGNLPGVTVNEGDTFGFDDWSTAITVRGFQTNLGEQQVGSTIDAGSRIYLVDANDNQPSPDPTCTVTNWYGLPEATAGINEDPSCFPADAIAVQSYRHIHYEKERTGLSLD